MNYKYKIYITWILLGAVALIFVFLIIPYLLNEINKSSEDFVSQKTALATFQSKMENLEKFKKSYQIDKENLDKIDNLFINRSIPSETVSFSNFLRKISMDNQVSINISSLSSTQEVSDPWPSQSFKIYAEGSFFQLAKFIEKIENAPYLIEISGLNIEKTDKSVTADFSIKVFSRQ